MASKVYEVGSGIIIMRNGPMIMLIDGAQKGVEIPMNMDQEHDLLLVDALRAARRDWQKEENMRRDGERLAAWNKSVIGGYKPEGDAE